MESTRLSERKTMFTFKKSELDEVIDILIESLKATDPDSPEYAKKVDQLSKLYAAKRERKAGNVSVESLTSTITNLMGIGMIVGHERMNVITSKAMSLIRKPK